MSYPDKEREVIRKELSDEYTPQFDMTKIANEEYITKSEAIEAACNAVELFPSEYPEMENAINSIPAADVAPVRRGRWIEEDGIQICSECGEEHEWEDYRAPYCDTCGAKMAEKAAKEEACQNGGN